LSRRNARFNTLSYRVRFRTLCTRYNFSPSAAGVARIG
jgi:hypothetical protein